MNKAIRIGLIFLAIISLSQHAVAQKKLKPGKYPGLLWEITGNGMKKPSYLFGTMHVSSKMAFHLGDSFYIALNNVAVVAIETKPEIWQQKLFENDDAAAVAGLYGLKNIFGGFPNDYFKKGSLAFGRYEKGIEVTLAMEPAMVNNLLYRNYESSNDFEEDTYLDMYIYQIGCKLKKQTTGVEDYEETEKLVDEAYEDMYKEKTKKKRSYDAADFKSGINLNDAYRNGDLDLLDSINRMNSTSDAFDEKFLYRRNEIQARSIDSIIKIHPLFVGVGAAHLPGTRGVIELLRRKGYTLRNIKMGERDGKQKDIIENLRVPVTFNQQTAADSFYKVMSPGKLYKADNSMISRSQYADMSNGSYYVVSRLKTNSLIWGQNAENTLKKVDSLLYENIPGKIIKKESIVKNGYKGFNIVNRTRKGDLQRYNIFVTPFEIIFFKMSGTGDYISKGDEAGKFFNSIELQPLKTSSWTKYNAPKGGFSIDFPHIPFISKEDNSIPSRLQFDAYDNADGNNYLLMKTEVHNMSAAGEDSFDLKLMEESFAGAEFIDRTLSSHQFIYKGYPALDCVYKHKDSSISKVRFLIQGPHYYSIVAHGKKVNENFTRFLNSFSITPFIYGPSIERKDTLTGFTVKSPVFPDKKTDLKKILKKMMRNLGAGYGGGGDEIEEGLEEMKNFSTINLGNDTTGEKIFILFVKAGKYSYEKDSSFFRSGMFNMGDAKDSSLIYRTQKNTVLANGFHLMEIEATDSGSSRLLKGKFFTRDGILLGAIAVTDTLSKPSTLLNDVFATLMPIDTLKSISPFTKKSPVFFADYFSGDSLLRKKTLKALSDLYVDSSDIPMIQKAIAALKWGDKDYLETKGKWIRKLGSIKDPATTDYLNTLYKEAGDTTSLQTVILSALLDQETAYSYKIYKDIFLSDPPTAETSSTESYDYISILRRAYHGKYKSSNTSGFDELYDSLELTKTIFTDMLPLINVDDYKTSMLNLLATMVDSGYISPKEYEPYFSKIYLEAKAEIKKQLASEKKASLEKAIKEAEKKDNTDTDYSYGEKQTDNGNEQLILYSRLLIPYWDKNTGVPVYFDQIMKSSDKRLKYDAAILLLKNKKNIPDTLLSYYAGMDNFRYELYTDLKEMDKLDKFPVKYKDLLLFAKAKLKDAGSYNNSPDTLVYLDKFKIDYKFNKGWLYFFKYKEKKDDAQWKIAIAGLLPESIDSFFTPQQKNHDIKSSLNRSDVASADFTKLTEQVIDPDEPIEKQLLQQFKEILYSLHKTGIEFYDEDNNNWYRTNLYGLKSNE
ncbi:MAG: TraB/GumN family protein [Ferruginibacter sp.]